MFARSLSRLASAAVLLVSAAVSAAGPVAVRLLDLQSVVGASWEPEQPTSTMRLLQYRVRALAAPATRPSSSTTSRRPGRVERGEHRALAVAVHDRGWRTGRAVITPRRPATCRSPWSSCAAAMRGLSAWGRASMRSRTRPCWPPSWRHQRATCSPSCTPHGDRCPARGDFEAFLAGLKPVAQP